MAEPPNDRDIYHDLHGQWPINPTDTSCANLNRNQQVHMNNEAFLPPPDHIIHDRYSHQDVFSSNVFPNNNCEKPGEPPVNFNENAYLNLNSNCDLNNMQNQQSFACLDLGNGQIVKTKIIYNEHNQPQYMVPINNYELFNSNIRHNMPMQPQCLPMMMNYMPPMAHNMSPENSSIHLEAPSYTHMPPVDIQQQQFNEINRNHPALHEINNMDSPGMSNLPTYEQPTVGKKHLIDNFLGNWNNNPSGTYTPFGHTFLNVQSNINYQREPSLINVNMESLQRGQDIPNSNIDVEKIKPVEQFNRKEQEGIFGVEVTGKKRIVAEVKPMRPSYSAVLSKTPKGQNVTENSKKKSNNKEQNKFNNMKQGLGKLDKTKGFMGSLDKPIQGEDKGKKQENSKKNVFHAQVSSGSDSGENSGEFPKKVSNSAKQHKYKNENVRKWVSLDDLSNDTDSAPSQEQPNYTNCDSEFVFVPQPEEKTNAKKRSGKKPESMKKTDKQDTNDSCYLNGAEEIIYQEPVNDTDKTKRRNKDGKSYNSKSAKSASDRNKRGTQPKNKKGRGAGYMGILQTHAENWLTILISVMVWFYNLLVDIFQMSAHLSVDLLSTLCTKTCTWSQNLWSFAKEQATNTQCICNIGTYIDKKFGHTRIGFWRKLKWFKTISKPENDAEKTKRNVTNIPLPATGDDAMKRLLACKGKDPYSILGVAVQCSDDDIKHYYRRQAFLVHPDKNQQPGAEEAFKILQHAFDLIGEPERREAYDRKLLESRHMEAAWSELSELLAQLHDKVRHAAGTIRCTNCTRRHKRTLTTRPCYAARYCAQCKINHSAKEGDIWAESGFWGLVWMYYACMDGAVYQITEWAACQKKNLNHLKANTHHVRYRIVLGNKLQPSGSGKQNTSSTSHDANLEDFLNNLYTKAKTNSGQPSSSSTNTKMPNSAPPTNEASKNKRKYKKNVKT